MTPLRGIGSAVAALSLLGGCQLFSLSSACGPDGSYCVTSTGGSGTTTSGTGGTTTSGTNGTTTGGATPGAPSNVVATAAKTSASVSWHAPASGGPVSTYAVTVESDGGLAGGLDAGGSLTATIPGLTPGQSYTFAVVAQNAAGAGPPGLSNAVVPFDVPDAPQNVIATATSGLAMVSWAPGPDGFSPITGYTVMASPGGQQVATDANTTTAMVPGLADYTAYTFSVTATNVAGVGPAGVSNTVATFAFVTTIAGNGDGGFADGMGVNATFYLPLGIAVDGQGSLYVGDSQNNRIRRITPDGTTSTLAGDGDAGYLDGPGVTAQFAYPAGVAVDANGNVYVADRGNSRIRQVAPDGTTTTLAGSGDAGWADGVGTAASFGEPSAVAVNAQGEILVADTFNFCIRTITADGTTSTLAGNPDAGYGFADGPGATALFYLPFGVAVGPLGNVFVGDLGNNRVRKVAPDGMTSTLAGDGGYGYADGTGGPDGTTNFAGPAGVAVDTHGNVYVADTGNNRVRKVAPDGTTTTLAGDGDAGYLDGPGGTAQFFEPAGVAVDAQGVVYVTDYLNNRIRRIVQ